MRGEFVREDQDSNRSRRYEPRGLRAHPKEGGRPAWGNPLVNVRRPDLERNAAILKAIRRRRGAGRADTAGCTPAPGRALRKLDEFIGSPRHTPADAIDMMPTPSRRRMRYLPPRFEGALAVRGRLVRMLKTRR